MNNQTKLKGQFIELRGKGWSYDKISRHTGIDKIILLRWGKTYRDCIDAEREINRSTLEEIRKLRSQTLDLEPIQQESHFYNLRGESPIPATPQRGPLNLNPRLSPSPRPRVPITTTPKRGRRSKSKIPNRKSKIVAGVRRLARSPIVRAAIRYAVLKH